MRGVHLHEAARGAPGDDALHSLQGRPGTDGEGVRLRPRPLLSAFLIVSASGCIGVFANDGGSVSLGTHAQGALLHGVVLPPEGSGYAVHPAWRGRDRLYTTEEMGRWLTGVFGTVERVLPGSMAYLGDLSPRGGGRSLEHKSHGSGRDVDIFFYAVDLSGRPYRSGPAMLRFRPDGRAFAWSPADRQRPCEEPLPLVRFDAPRTWALVRAMLTDPTAEVQWIFVHRALAALMIREGAAAGEDPALLARAAALFHQPTDAQAHDDHMHVRVYCPLDDRALGCIDRGPQRWWKKRWKYMSAVAEAAAASSAVTFTSAVETR